MQFLALHQGFKKKNKKIKLFAVQPASHNPISSMFDPHPPETSTSTTALSVRSLPLKNKVLNAIKNSTGQGLTIPETSLLTSQELLESKGITSSFESYLAFAGYRKAQTLALPIGDHPIILFTGRKY